MDKKKTNVFFIFKEENEKYKEIIKEKLDQNKYSVEYYKKIDDAFLAAKDNLFKLYYFILEDNLAEEFSEKYIEEIKDINVILFSIFLKTSKDTDLESKPFFEDPSTPYCFFLF